MEQTTPVAHLIVDAFWQEVFGMMVFMHCFFMKQTNEVFIVYGKIMPWLDYT